MRPDDNRKHEEKLEAFAACFCLMLIMLLLVVISAVGETLLDMSEYAALQLTIVEEEEHDQFY